MLTWLVDAFSSKPFQGNPAGVCLVEEFPNLNTMQNIASEIGHSETAFIKKNLKDKNHYYIRWFTPNSEAPLCGHATIAAAHVLIQEQYVKSNEEIKFTNNDQNFLVNKTENLLNLTFPYYEVEEINLYDEVQNITNISPKFVGISKNVILAEFREYSEIINCVPNLNLISLLPYRALIITSQHKKYDFASRYFAPKVGIDEDPVCASAHCRLIPYWSSILGKNTMIAYQASQRGGIIKCKNLKKNVLISGEAFIFLKGKLNLSH